jgi:hypothetical protein
MHVLNGLLVAKVIEDLTSWKRDVAKLAGICFAGAD